MEKIKYPRTYHLSWSRGLTNDDKAQIDYETLKNCPTGIVALLKMDGENITFSRDFIHARSLDSNNHPSRNYVKGMWGNMQHLIPQNWRICGENLYAKHSIAYDDLESYFQVFNIWDGDWCFDYGETLEICKELGLVHCKCIYEGKYDEDLLKKLPLTDEMRGHEGYVIRTYGSFKYEDFNRNVAKYVRANHVQTTQHWSTDKIIPNKLKNDNTIKDTSSA